MQGWMKKSEGVQWSTMRYSKRHDIAVRVIAGATSLEMLLSRSFGAGCSREHDEGAGVRRLWGNISGNARELRALRTAVYKELRQLRGMGIVDDGGCLSLLAAQRDLRAKRSPE